MSPHRSTDWGFISSPSGGAQTRGPQRGVLIPSDFAGSSSQRREVINVAGNTRQTGSKAASDAGKVLANPRSTKAEKAAAASSLSHSPRTNKKK